ncbi:MAG: CopG family transcriptional regulator [Campylobacterota bacterium]|nr:CopG family transcriptional regulator [Campylobacterota bacterium]
MKKIIKYTDEPIGDIKIIEDFLPSPKDLIFKENVKVTISLTKESIDFFKAEAKKHHTQYQKMIRNLLDVYAENHSRGLANL